MFFKEIQKVSTVAMLYFNQGLLTRNPIYSLGEDFDMLF